MMDILSLFCLIINVILSVHGNAEFLSCGLKPGFHLCISLIADDFFSHEKCSHKICCCPSDLLTETINHEFHGSGAKIWGSIILLIFADEN